MLRLITDDSSGEACELPPAPLMKGSTIVLPPAPAPVVSSKEVQGSPIVRSAGTPTFTLKVPDHRVGVKRSADNLRELVFTAMNNAVATDVAKVLLAVSGRFLTVFL